MAVSHAQLTFDDITVPRNAKAAKAVAGVLTADLARIATRVTEFWRNVSIRSNDECWPWTGYLNDDGYGEFFFAGKMRGAHELAVTFTTGEVRDPRWTHATAATPRRAATRGTSGSPRG